MRKRNIFKQLTFTQYLKNMRTRWKIPSIRYDRSFRKKTFTKGRFRYKIRKYTIPRSINGGRFKIYMLKGYRRY